MSFRDRLRFVWRTCVGGPWVRAAAAWRGWTGRHEEAEQSLRRLAERLPQSFGAQLAWGRSLLALGRDAEARDALRRACRISPVRFLRQNLPASLREVVAVECVLNESALIGCRRSPTPVEPAPAPCGARVGGDPAPAGSDFVDGDEARRFQAMGPLGKTAAKDVDWDDLLDRLARPPRSGGPRGS
jgi:hypothetical protein